MASFAFNFALGGAQDQDGANGEAATGTSPPPPPSPPGQPQTNDDSYGAFLRTMPVIGLVTNHIITRPLCLLSDPPSSSQAPATRLAWDVPTELPPVEARRAVEVGVGPPLHTLAALHNGEKRKMKIRHIRLLEGAWRAEAGCGGGGGAAPLHTRSAAQW
jgi:hypothetical protein